MQDQGAGQLGMFAAPRSGGSGTTGQELIDHAIEEVHAKTAQEVVATWNKAAEDLGIPTVRTLTQARKRKIIARTREKEFSIERIIEKIRRSAFLRGENDRGWVVTLDFVIRSEDSYTRILEGMYDGRRNAKRTNRIDAAAGKYEGV